MLLQDLFEKLEPGEQRAIQLKIDRLKSATQEIENQQQSLKSIEQLPVIPGTEKELEELKQAYQKMIDDLQAKLDAEKKKKGGDDFEKYMTAIVRHCPTIVKMCQETNMLLYRGVKERAPAFYASPFTKREPKDSYKDIHNAWNHAMDLMGVKAKRDNSIFTITSRGHASNFGDQVYIVFFRDPFNFTWSENIKDLVLDWEKAIEMVNPETVKSIMSYVWENEELQKEFKIYYGDSNAKFDKNDYPHGDSYDGNVFERYNFRKSFDALKSILPKMPDEFKKYASFDAWVDPETLTKNFGLHFDEDLRGAFESGHEITINANYYAIRTDFEKRVREYLKMNSSNY